MPHTDDDLDWDQSRYDAWWSRLRRAYGIPDLISDAHASAMLIALAGAGLTIQGANNQEMLLGEVLERILNVGATGRLDNRLLTGDLATAGSTAFTSEVTSAIITQTSAAQESLSQLQTIADAIIAKVTASVTALPYEDNQGRWYALT